MLTAVVRRPPQLGEADYDARLAAYGQLQEAKWAQLPGWHSAPLVHAALADLRNADDIALRHAAAQVCSQPIRMSDGSLLLMNMNGDVNHRDVSQGRLSPLRCATPQPSCTASEGSDAGTPSVAWGPGWQLDGAVNNWLPNEFHCGRHSPKLLLSACLNFKSVRAR